MTAERLVILSRAELGSGWDDAAAAWSSTWLWHRSAYAAALATWPGRSDQSFAVCTREERPLALFPLHRVDRGVRPFLVTALDSSGGPALQEGIDPALRSAVIATLRQALHQRAAAARAIRVAVRWPALAPAVREGIAPADDLLAALGMRPVEAWAWIVDLRGGVDAVWRGIHKKTRNAIRQSERAGIRVRDVDRSDDLDAYVALHRQTYRRTGARPHPHAYFEALWRDFFLPGRGWALIAELDGRPVAGATFGRHGDGAVYWTGASDERGLRLHANALLQWHGMRRAVEAGASWFESGAAARSDTEGKQQGLSEFKRKFGGEARPVPCAELMASSTLGRALVGAERLWSSRRARTRRTRQRAHGA